jgi:protein-tyrosine kinase
MNKLEKAISLSLSKDNYSDNIFSDMDSSKSMEEISKMKSDSVATNEELDQAKLIYPGCKQEQLVDQLREIRTEINKQSNKNLIMVTSMQEKSGVSFFASNIAAATAFDAGRSSLLVECNFDAPVMKSKFKLDSTNGLVDYIYNSEIKENDIIQETGIKRYRVIHGGDCQSSSQEHFVHPRFRKFLMLLKSRYSDRTVYVDAPPLTSSADARILADLCDLVIIILPNGKVSKKRLETATKLIPHNKLLGVVVNNYIY